MTFIFSGSYFPITSQNPADAFYRFKTMLSQSGFVVISSSNGTALQAGDLITSGSVLANANAYFILKQPLSATGSHGGLRREWGVQCGGTANVWRISYCASSSHTNGGTASVMASGSDRKWILEGDAAWQAGGYTTAMIANAATRFYMGVDQTFPHAFFMVGVPRETILNTFGTPNLAWYYDPLLTGSYKTGDYDPSVHYCSNNANNSFMIMSNNAAGMQQGVSGTYTLIPKGWMSSAFVGLPIPIPRMRINTAQIDDMLVDGTTYNCYGGVDTWVAFYFKPTTTFGGIGGMKGSSSILRGLFTPCTSLSLFNSGSGTQNLICFKNFVLPWASGNIPSGAY